VNFTSSLLEYDVTLELNKTCPSVREEATNHKSFHGTKLTVMEVSLMQEMGTLTVNPNIWKELCEQLCVVGD